MLFPEEGRKHPQSDSTSVLSIVRTKNSDLIPKKGRQEFFLKSHATSILGIHVTGLPALLWKDLFLFTQIKQCFGFFPGWTDLLIFHQSENLFFNNQALK